jgi:hypothetical protein
MKLPPLELESEAVLVAVSPLMRRVGSVLHYCVFGKGPSKTQ